MNLKAILIIALQIFGLTIVSYAKENPKNPKFSNEQASFRTDCVRPTAQYEMSVNNVRARILTGGDLFSTASYVTPVPKAGQLPVSAIYAAGIWMSGLDIAGNIRLSASTYRNEGYDYFAGPLDVNGATDSQSCNNWNRIFSVKGDNIKKHIQAWKDAELSGQSLDCDKIPDDVKYWPAQGNPYFVGKFGWELPDQTLAAYWDNDANGEYDPCEGDYPILQERYCQTYYHEGLVVPAEIDFIVFNDNGNVQSLSGPNRLRMEVQVNSFAYSTNDELNDMTFFQYKLINKAPEDLIDCYFSFWIDPDLGCYQDDYIGYDPINKMAYVYNQDEIDGINGTNCEGTNTYGANIPLIGFNVFGGLSAPKIFKKDDSGNILLDNDGNKILIDPAPLTGLQDTIIEVGLSSVNYMENCGLPGSSFPPGTCDPRRGREDDFYNYMRGLWADGTPLTFGGSGYNPASTDTVRFAFDGEPNDPNGWSMCTSNLQNGDRKFLLNQGPILLQPGSINQFTFLVTTAFDIKHPCPDISKLRYSNTLAQNLFGNCFEDFVVGPDAPELKAESKDKEIVINIDNLVSSNNYQESYTERISTVDDQFDQFYKFEGYKVYQVRTANTSRQLLNDIGSARLIAQSDIQNNITEIFNWKNIVNPDPTSNEDYIWTKESKVVASNSGLINNFSFTEDQFATGDKTLINGKNYHFMVVAYAHNNWKEFDPTDGSGQKTPYIESLNNVKVFTFVPNLMSSTNSYNHLTNIFLSPNPISRSQSDITLRLFNLPEQVTINIFDTKGNLVKKCHQNEGSSEFLAGPGVKESKFNINANDLSQGLHFVQIIDQKSGDIKTLKWMVL